MQKKYRARIANVHSWAGVSFADGEVETTVFSPGTVLEKLGFPNASKLRISTETAGPGKEDIRVKRLDHGTDRWAAHRLTVGKRGKSMLRLSTRQELQICDLALIDVFGFLPKCLYVTVLSGRSAKPRQPRSRGMSWD